MENKIIDKHFGNFFIAGFTYWEGCMALDEILFLKEADKMFNA